MSERQKNKFFESALSLHEYLPERHWTGEALVGPDPGVRFNSRVGRFIKSYLPRIQWGDNYYYPQAQGYWIMANWHLFDLLKEEKFREITINSSQKVLKEQKSEGYWLHPNPEWKNRIQTVEGTFAALGLLGSFVKTGKQAFLQAALSWFVIRILKGVAAISTVVAILFSYQRSVYASVVGAIARVDEIL